MRKILVIDDDSIIRSYFERLLTRLGYTVSLAANGAEGLIACENPEIDLIISDLFMPGAPFGIELIRQFREKRPTCPIVVISGEGGMKIVQDCAALGVTEFLTKPFEMGFIRDVLQRLIQP
ncbi:MAG: response regulator [Kiritimatiellia bacterium]